MATWGPLLWRILHTAAEHLGKPRPALLQTDEVNRWMFVLKAVENTMPCALCRSHYKVWLKKNPVTQFTRLRGDVLKETARKWLYDLHENVNEGRKVASGIQLEQLPALYSSLAGYQEVIDKFISLIRENIQHGHVNMEGFLQFRTHLHYLRKISDIGSHT
jgi:hypothetical protein